MRLTVYTDFSLRVLMYIALNPDRRPTIAEIAGSYGISRNHLMKVVYQLASAGYIVTVRGKNGGMGLARPASRIGLGEIVRHAEPDMALVPCFDPVRAACVISPACKLRRALYEAHDAFFRVLDGYSLADLVEDEASLAALLGSGPRPEVPVAERMLATSPDAPED